MKCVSSVVLAVREYNGIGGLDHIGEISTEILQVREEKQMRGGKSEVAVIEGLALELQLRFQRRAEEDEKDRQLLEFLLDLIIDREPRGPATVIQFPRVTGQSDAA